MQKQLNNVTPHDIIKLVQFNASDIDWRYNENIKDMYSYQAEGAAGIYNRFEHFGMAILGDEVGMGKTFQALSVIAKQFNDKRDAKILIFTPRKEVLSQWKDVEYEEFVKNHLIDKDLLPDMANVDELYNLENGLNPNNKQLVFAKVTSLSYLNQYENSLRKCIDDIEKFDLIVVDEAHLFRNFTSDFNYSNARTDNASQIFKHSKANILLMTATPLHSKEEDIVSIVKVFKSDIENIGITSTEIMNKIMIRRLRVMSSGVNKYAYRHEQQLPVSLANKNDYKNELFFAMLQKSIIEQSSSKDLSKSKNLLDLLEGTTFDDSGDQFIDDEKSIKNSLKEIVKIYNNIYKKMPSNQKYDDVLERIHKQDEKALVFVRRRASALMLAKKNIEEFDKIAWLLLGILNKNIPERNRFDSVFGFKNIDNKIADFVKMKAVEDFISTYKKYIQFKPRTHERTILNIMANDYFERFEIYSSLNFLSFKDQIEKESKIKQEHIDEKIPKSKVLDFFKTKKGEVSTYASRFVRKFDQGRSYDEFFVTFLPELLKYKDDKDKFELIKSAVLHASIGVIELFKLDMKTKNYKSFCKKVEFEYNLGKLSFTKEVQDFITYFDKFEKYIKTNENAVSEMDNLEEEMTKSVIQSYDVSIFHNAQPSYPYLSDTKNKNVIARFNSPFFPKMLCGTSTLQEGLNLHLFCNKVYHFGSAHTMGDDEQRTGRVDRVHGKMDRELRDNKDSKLDICYPYLEKTFDEENLRLMLCSKRSTEKKIDRCQVASQREMNMTMNKNGECDQSIAELMFSGTKQDISNETEPFGWKLLEIKRE